MGFTGHRRVLKLTFEDPEYEGMLVRVRGLTIGQWRSIGDADADHEGDDAVFALFLQSLVEWNLEDELADGSTEPVPQTMEGMHSLEPPTAKMIVDAWIEHGIGVAAPLDQPSSDGEPSVEESLPMEPLSSSLAS